MNVMELVKTEITSHIGSLHTTNAGWHKRNCMMCHTRGHSVDKRGRFGILYDGDQSIALNCFNCGFKATFKTGSPLSNNFKSFLKEIGVAPESIKKIEFQNSFFSRSQGVSDTNTVEPVVIQPMWPAMSLPENSLSLIEWYNYGCRDKEYMDVLSYAVQRGITKLGDFYWTPNLEHRMNNRLIHPFRYNGTIVGYTARYAGDPPNKYVSRHMHFMPENFVYNLSPHHNHKFIILCEGVMDAYFVHGVSALGNSMNDKRAKLINDLGKLVIVCPDQDEAGKDLVKAALRYGWAVSFPKWAYDIKDSSDAILRYGQITTVLSILESVVYDESKIRELSNIFTRVG